MINMAKKEETKSKIILERTYVVPLRREFVKASRYKRSNKASKALKEFLIKHMKSEDVKIGKHLNQYIWQNGIQNPPPRVKITAIKDDKGIVRAEIFGKEIELEKKEKKKESVAERIGLKQKQKEELTQTYKPKSAEKTNLEDELIDEETETTEKKGKEEKTDNKIKETKKVADKNEIEKEETTKKVQKEEEKTETKPKTAVKKTVKKAVKKE
jgi:large subunit ribosomal protein L31e